MTNEQLRDHVTRRWAALKTERSSWESHWRELADFFLPRRGRFLVKDRKNDGSKRNQNLIDPTGGLAVRTLAAGMMAGLTSPARPWFKLTVPGFDAARSDAVRGWLHDVGERMNVVFAKSNLYNVLPVIYSELGVFGTSAMALLEDDEDVIRAYPFTIGSYAIANSARLQSDTLYRECSMTVSQIVEQFGLENASATVREAWRNKSFDRWMPVIHAVEPRRDRVLGRADARNMPIRSVYLEVGAEAMTVLSDRGFEEFPIMTPRWEVTGEDVYGSSPGMLALGSVKALQLMAKKKAKAVDKIIDPPMVGDESLRSSRASLLPGDVTYLSGTAQARGFVPAHEIQPGMLTPLLEDIANERELVNRTFFVDLFLMLAMSDRRQITAREVEERHEEKLLMLGPVLERLEDELLDPLIDRTFSIMLRRGLIPDPPPELQGQDLKVEYISILAQAQKLVGLTALERTAGFAIQLATVKPDAMDKLDTDQLIDEYALASGAPPTIIRSDDAVAAMRAQAQQQMAAMQAAESAPKIAGAMKQASEADPTAGALGALVNAAGAAPAGA